MQKFTLWVLTIFICVSSARAEEPDSFLSTKEIERKENLAWLRLNHDFLFQHGTTLTRAAVIASPIAIVGEMDASKFESTLDQLLSAADLNAPALWKLAYACRMPGYWNTCESRQVRKMLALKAPNNTAAHLWPVRNESDEAQRQWVLPRAQVLMAADAHYHDSYIGRGMHLIYEQARDAVAQNPHDSEINGGPPAHQAFWVSYGLLVTSLDYSPLFDACQQAVMGSDEALVSACFKVAVIIDEQSKSMLDSQMGAALKRRMLMLTNPESIEALNLWRKERIESKAIQCLGKWAWPDVQDYLNKGDEYYYDLYKNLSELGEIAWIEHQADRTYSLRPSAQERTPAECRALRKLEGQDLIAELGNSDPFSAWQKEIRSIRLEKKKRAQAALENTAN